MIKVIYRTEVFSDGRRYVGLCPEFRISGTGDSQVEAVDRLRKGVEAHLQKCKGEGILEMVLEESGFEEAGGAWKLKERFSEEQIAVVASPRTESMASGVLREGISR